LATTIVSSSADSLSGSLDADGFTTTVAPFAQVSGAAPPAYDDTKRVASFNRLYDLTPGDSNELSLQMQATHMLNSANSAGMGIDEIGATGAADLGSAYFLLADTLGPSGPTALGLSVEATGVHSESSSSFVVGSRGFVSGDASFSSVTITGALVNGEALHFSGDAAPDTVLYSSPTVTITLDDQILLLPPATGLIGPTITTDAIDIRINDAKFGGHTISGDFAFGQSSASHVS
jgi:hypothetical protein